MMFTTPVLFIVFNRPKTTLRVLEKIREAKPRQLFIASDGPRNPEDLKRIEEVREIIQKLVDWECRVEYRYNQENAGCKLAVSSAISWFFDQVDEGIILEDDCLPDNSFFSFCEAMLKTHRNDHRIGHISGSHLLNSKEENSSSYFYSRYAFTWGWASWARVWRNYDLSLKDYQSLDYDELFKSPFEALYWLDKFHQCAIGATNTWDHQYFYTLCTHRFLSVNPYQNLISNIGFMDRPTHWSIKNFKFAHLPIRELTHIVHPEAMETNPLLDREIYESIFKRTLPANFFLYLKYFSQLQSKERISMKPSFIRSTDTRWQG